MAQWLSQSLLIMGIGSTTGIALAVGAIATVQAASLTQWQYDPVANQLELTVKDGTTPRYFLMAQPARIVVDLPDTSVGEVATQQTYTGAVRSIRVSQFQPGLARIVMELSPDISLAPGQVKLEKAAGNSRWVLQPLIAKAPSNQPPLAQAPKPVIPIAPPSGIPSSAAATSPPPVSAPSVSPSASVSPPSVSAATPTAALPDSTTVAPVTNVTSTALSPPPSVNTTNASIRRPSSPKPVARPTPSQPKQPTVSKPSTADAEDVMTVDTAGGMAIAVPPPESPTSPQPQAQTTALPSQAPVVVVPSSAPTASSVARSTPSPALPTPGSPAPLDIPTTLASSAPGSKPTITVPPLDAASPAVAPSGTAFPPVSPRPVPALAQATPVEFPNATPSGAGIPGQPAIAVPPPAATQPSPGVRKKPAIVIPPPTTAQPFPAVRAEPVVINPTTPLPPSIASPVPPTVNVPPLSPSVPSVVNDPLPGTAYPPALNVPPLVPTPSRTSAPSPQPAVPASSVFRPDFSGPTSAPPVPAVPPRSPEAPSRADTPPVQPAVPASSVFRPDFSPPIPVVAPPSPEAPSRAGAPPLQPSIPASSVFRPDFSGPTSAPPVPARPTGTPVIEFGQPLPAVPPSPTTRGAQPGVPHSSLSAQRSLVSDVSLPAGTVLDLHYPGQTSLELKTGAPQAEVLVVRSDIRNSAGTLIAPSGAVVTGRFETNPSGSRFIAQAILLQGRAIPLAAQSDVLGANRKLTDNNLVQNAGVGLPVGGPIGEVAGGNPGLGAAGGETAGTLTALSTPKFATIHPGQLIQVKLLEDFR